MHRCDGVLVMLLLAVPCSAEILRVPQPYPTIQAAVNVALNGDTVLIANGRYSGVGNHSVYIRDKAITVTSEGGAQNCIIDCQGVGRGFVIRTGCVLDGLTIMNGFTDGSGGGIAVSYYTGAIIRNCVVVGNHAAGGGGGIYCYESTVQVSDCLIVGNRSDLNGGGVACARGRPSFLRCQILNNSAYFRGGGISSSASEATFTSCLIQGNHCDTWGGGIGEAGGTYINCAIIGNHANRHGGGIFTEPSAYLVNCILYGNTADGVAGGIFANDGGYMTLVNSILWGNLPQEIGRSDTGVDPKISYSIVRGGWPGVGNLNADPLWVDPNAGDFHLMQASPAIDAGDNEARLLPETDIDGDPRIGNCRVDVGVEESPYYRDCNGNDQPDACDIREGRSRDVNDNGIPDECDAHCSGREKLRLKCRARRAGNALSAILRRGLPIAPVTLQLDGEPNANRYVSTGDTGNARARWTSVAPGLHEVCVTECDGVCNGGQCPD